MVLAKLVPLPVMACLVLVLSGCGTSPRSDTTATETAPVACGCGSDSYTKETCPANGFGPLSARCAEAPGTKVCGCEGDSPCGGNPCEAEAEADTDTDTGGGW